MKPRRGRPVGWRKPDRKSAKVMVRLSPSMIAWLRAQSTKHGLPMSELIRQAIERAMEGNT